jgi:hypothetical protein
VRESVELDAEPAEVLATLHARPRALDPFAREPGQAEPAARVEQFAGTLGEDVVIWADGFTRTRSGVVCDAAPGWVWRRLRRSADVRAGGEGGTVLEIRVVWNAGAGHYEDFVGGPIEFSVRRRLERLVEDFAAHVKSRGCARSTSERDGTSETESVA